MKKHIVFPERPKHLLNALYKCQVIEADAPFKNFDFRVYFDFIRVFEWSKDKIELAMVITSSKWEANSMCQFNIISENKIESIFDLQEERYISNFGFEDLMDFRDFFMLSQEKFQSIFQEIKNNETLIVPEIVEGLIFTEFINQRNNRA